MTVQLYKRTGTGAVYLIRDPDGRTVGQVDWIMSGDRVGIHCYSHDSKYKPAKIQKIFRHSWRA